MKIAVYTIALNEEKHVQSWFDSAKDADVLLIADTGSSDRTVEVATSLGISVHKIKVDPFRFDVARNASLALIPEDIDMCIQLDMDETLSSGWRVEVENAFAEGNVWPVYKQVTGWDANRNITSSFDYFKIHPRKGFIWRYPIHEVVAPVDNTVVYHRRNINVQAWHNQDRGKNRSSYLNLLEVAVKEMPHDWRMQHYLCREYMYNGRWADVIKSATNALKLKDGWDIERAACCMWASEGAHWLGFDDWAFEWAVKGTEEAPTFYETWHWRAHIAHLLKNWDETLFSAKKIDSLERQTHHLVKPDVWKWWGFDLVALAAHNLGDNETALVYGQKALQGVPHDGRLTNNLKTYKDARDRQSANKMAGAKSQKKDSETKAQDLEIYVLHLARHEERFEYFNKHNSHIPEVNWFEGIDGKVLDRDQLERDGVISKNGNWPDQWPNGALAGALGHRALWEICVKADKPIIVLEDDAVMATDFHAKVQTLMNDLPHDWEILHLTWNFGSHLYLDMLGRSEGVATLWIKQIDLQAHLTEFQNMPAKSHLYKLLHSFGMGAYIISPLGAKRLLAEKGLYSSDLVDRADIGLKYFPNALSMNLNWLYPTMKAYVAFPAVAFVENLQEKSTIWNPDETAN